MAINYTALTSLTQPGVAAATTAMMDQLKIMIPANPAWSLVEDVTVGTSPFRYLVFKCSAAQSGLPNDYYVLFYLSAGSGTIFVLMGEQYTPATHTLTWPIVTASSNGVLSTSDAAGHYSNAGTAAYNPAANGAPSLTGAGTGGIAVSPSWTSGGTTWFYLCVVYPDHIIFGAGPTAGLSSGVAYIGGFQSLVSGAATNDPCPICMTTFIGGSSSGFTRDAPPFVGVGRYNGNLMVPVPNTTSSATNGIETGRSIASAYDYIQAMYHTSRVFVLSTASMVSGVSSASVRGRFSNVVYASAQPTSIAIGDTVTFGGTSWVLVSSGYFVDTGAP